MTNGMNKKLPLSVIICTYDRPNLLRQVLESLVGQTLPQEDFEVVVIDDGSPESTREIVEPFMNVLPLNYLYQNNAGLASAKNHGIFASRGEIVLFLDDDDVAMPALLEEHIRTHRKYHEKHFAVLHYTAWSPELTVTPLMHFVTDVGCFLFSYPNIRHGSILDYTYFWGGRSSCKRSFLMEHGVFNQVFRFGCEDIELGYRLSRQGLKVVYNNKAVSRMIRPVLFDDFCRRLIRQGRSQYIFSSLHNDPEVYNYTEIIGAEDKWKTIQHIYDAKMRSARELDKVANTKLKYQLELDDTTKGLLHKAYWWAFRACKIKGIMESKMSMQQKDGIGQEKTAAGLLDSVLALRDDKGISENDFVKEAAVDNDHLAMVRINSLNDYRKYTTVMQSELGRREQYEKSLLNHSKPFTIDGFCHICRQPVQFLVDFTAYSKKNGFLVPNWRECLVCPNCGLNNRMRAAMHLFEELLHPNGKAKIYIPEQSTRLFRWLAEKHPDVVGSEYVDGTAAAVQKRNSAAVRAEDMTRLSFPDGHFDFVLSFDVFEHIPDFRKALSECFRVLKPDGSLFFTVPFDVNSGKSIVRAVVKQDNEIEHLLPPEYHGDPVSDGGCLSFYFFGWELLDNIKDTGFEKTDVYLYWSSRFGYLGDDQSVFIARKGKDA